MVAFSVGTTIKRIGLRDFQRSFYTHIKGIKEEPVILTKKEKPHLVIMSYKYFTGTREMYNEPDLTPWNNGTTITVPKLDSFKNRVWSFLNRKIA